MNPIIICLLTVLAVTFWFILQKMAKAIFSNYFYIIFYIISAAVPYQ